MWRLESMHVSKTEDRCISAWLYMCWSSFFRVSFCCPARTPGCNWWHNSLPVIHPHEIQIYMSNILLIKPEWKFAFWIANTWADSSLNMLTGQFIDVRILPTGCSHHDDAVWRNQGPLAYTCVIMENGLCDRLKAQVNGIELLMLCRNILHI